MELSEIQELTGKYAAARTELGDELNELNEALERVKILHIDRLK